MGHLATAMTTMNEMPEKTPIAKPTTTLPTTKPLMPEKPDRMTTMKPGMTKMPYSHHTTTQRITPGEAETRKRERVSMRECGPMQRGRPCAAESDISWMPRLHASGSDFRRTLGRSAWAFAGIGSE